MNIAHCIFTLRRALLRDSEERTGRTDRTLVRVDQLKALLDDHNRLDRIVRDMEERREQLRKAREEND